MPDRIWRPWRRPLGWCSSTAQVRVSLDRRTRWCDNDGLSLALSHDWRSVSHEMVQFTSGTFIHNSLALGALHICARSGKIYPGNATSVQLTWPKAALNVDGEKGASVLAWRCL